MEEQKGFTEGWEEYPAPFLPELPCPGTCVEHFEPLFVLPRKVLKLPEYGFSTRIDSNGNNCPEGNTPSGALHCLHKEDRPCSPSRGGGVCAPVEPGIFRNQLTSLISSFCYWLPVGKRWAVFWV